MANCRWLGVSMLLPDEDPVRVTRGEFILDKLCHIWHDRSHKPHDLKFCCFGQSVRVQDASAYHLLHMTGLPCQKSGSMPAADYFPLVGLCQQKKDIKARLCDEAPSAICVELRPKRLEKEVLRVLPLPICHSPSNPITQLPNHLYSIAVRKMGLGHCLDHDYHGMDNASHRGR